MVAILPFKEADLFADFSSRGTVQKSADKLSITVDDFPVVVGSEQGVEGVKKEKARIDIDINGSPRIFLITESGVSGSKISLDENSRKNLLEAASSNDVSVVYRTEEPRIRGVVGKTSFVFDYQQRAQEIKLRDTPKTERPVPRQDVVATVEKEIAGQLTPPTYTPSEDIDSTTESGQEAWENLLDILEKQPKPGEGKPPEKPKTDRTEKQKAKEQPKFFVPWQIIIDVLGEDEAIVENLVTILKITTSESYGVQKNELERLFTGLYDSKKIGRLRGEYRDTREWALLERIQRNGFNLISQINQAATEAKG